MGISEKVSLIVDEWSIQRLAWDSPDGDTMREIFQFLAFRKEEIHTETSSQIHDTVRNVWREDSELFNYFKDIVHRGELPPLEGQSNLDSIRDLCRLRGQTKGVTLVLTPKPELYEGFDEFNTVPITPEQFNEFIIADDEEYRRFLEEL